MDGFGVPPFRDPLCGLVAMRGQGQSNRQRFIYGLYIQQELPDVVLGIAVKGSQPAESLQGKCFGCSEVHAADRVR